LGGSLSVDSTIARARQHATNTTRHTGAGSNYTNPELEPVMRRRRLPESHRYCHIKQWRGLATRYDKHATVYRAAVVLNAVIAWARRLSDPP
jgi:hypothetical protein